MKTPAEIIHADALEALRKMSPGSVDAIVTDPPYGLRFMSKRWDYDVPRAALWAEGLRVLKPGGHLLSFAGTRTQHRMAVNIEDAGFEIRDMIAWVYGNGFPKSLNLKGDWDGWGTALKPALEPITVARKPLAGTVAGNVLEYGTGALNIAASRVGTEEITTQGEDKFPGVFGDFATCSESTHRGRWPANLIHDGSAEVLGLMPESRSSGGTGETTQSIGGRGKYQGGDNRGFFNFGDSGSAARFFYCAKASKAEREAGCDELDTRTLARSGGAQGAEKRGTDYEEGQGIGLNRVHKTKNYHPTVKPVALMRYLVRLVTPPAGLVLDPFAGSGTTGVACVLEGFRFIGVDNSPDYCDIARARIRHAEKAARQAGGEQLELLAEMQRGAG